MKYTLLLLILFGCSLKPDIDQPIETKKDIISNYNEEFDKVIPLLKSWGYSDKEINQMRKNKVKFVSEPYYGQY